MGRKDLIEALQELEQRRRNPAPAEGGVSPSPPAGPPEPAAPAASAVPVQPSPTAPKLQRVEQPTAEVGGPAHARSGARALPGLRILGQPLVLACLLLAFAVGFLLGNSRPSSATEARTGPASARTNAPARAPVVGSSPTVTATGAGAESADAAIEAALADPANQFTVLAISYDDTARNAELAGETTRHFRTAGLAAADPRRSGPYVVVVVGAAATRGELLELRDRVRAMGDASGRSGSFVEAEIYAIDSLFGN